MVQTAIYKGNCNKDLLSLVAKMNADSLRNDDNGNLTSTHGWPQQDFNAKPIDNMQGLGTSTWPNKAPFVHLRIIHPWQPSLYLITTWSSY